jgi:nucleotide exchange factor SIL1
MMTMPTKMLLLVLIVFACYHVHLQPYCCSAKEMEVTNEWQVVGENDTVPAGVHVRMDLSTGQKWVKLVTDEDGDESGGQQEASSSSSSMLAIVNEDGSVHVTEQQQDSSREFSTSTSTSTNNYDFDLMYRTLSKLPEDEQERMGGLPELPQSSSDNTKTVTPAERRAFEARMLEIWKRRQAELAALQEQLMDFPAILRERIKAMDEYLKDPETFLKEVDLDAELPEGMVTHIVSVLDDLQFQVSDIDMARDFHTMGGWPLLASMLSEDSHVDVNKTVDSMSRPTQAKIRTLQALAAGTMGTSIKNTEEFFPFSVEMVVIDNGETATTPVDLLIDIFCRDYSDDWESRTLLSKSIYAIGAMLRGNRLAQAHVLQQGGFAKLGDRYRTLSSQERFNSANIKLVLRLSSLASDIVEDVQLHPELGDSSSNQAIIDSLTSSVWCDATHQSLTSDTFLPVKVQESILHSVAILAPHCQWPSSAWEAMELSIANMQKEWESSKESFDSEHWEQLHQLADRVKSATK